MNVRQRNYVAMFMALKQFIETHRTQLETIPALATAIQQFLDLLPQIEQVNQIQLGHAKGSSDLKQKEEAEMIQATIQVAAAIFVYAQVNNRPDLQAKVNVSPTYLQELPDEELKITCLNIHSTAEKLDGNLSNFGITPEAITQLKKEIDDFAAIIAAPRSAIVTRSQATRRLKELIDQANDLLRNQLDKLMVLFEHTQPQVYNTYKAARVIVDLKRSVKAEEE